MTTEGNVVHYGFIENFIDELGTRFNIREIAFDRWGTVQMSQNLEGLGFTLVQFGQGYSDMSPPTKELMKLTLEQKIAHNGHPVLRYNMDNIFIKRDPAGNIKPDKEKSTEKIDGTVATIMALDRAIRCGNDTGDSIYLSLEFVKYTLDPWIVRWEQGMQKALLSDSEKGRYFIKFNVEGLLRGDYASRMQGYATARQNGWLSANDIRELEDMNSIPDEDGGNLYLVNGSFTKLADAGAFYEGKEGDADETSDQ